MADRVAETPPSPSTPASDEPGSKMKRISSATKIGDALKRVGSYRRTSNTKTMLEEDDKDWHVGGRYEVGRLGVAAYSDAECSHKLSDLKKGSVILLLSVFLPEDPSSGAPPIGMVTPAPGQSPVWLYLEDAADKKGGHGTGPVIKNRRDDSWEIKGRYSAVHAATLRQTTSITSAATGELVVGQEIFIIELSVNYGDAAHGLRLRARIGTVDGGLIGWMSPEPLVGDPLLDPVNLVGPAVVDMHMQSLRSLESMENLNTEERKKKGLARCIPSRKKRPSSMGNVDSGGMSESPSGSPSNRPNTPKVSWHQGSSSEVPWRVGGQYRSLENLTLTLGSNTKVADLPASTLVTVQEVRLNCDGPQDTRTSPYALVVVHDGPFEGKTGWLPCTSCNGGHDLLDSRDQKEFEKVYEKVRSSDALLQEQSANGVTVTAPPSLDTGFVPGITAQEPQELPAVAEADCPEPPAHESANPPAQPAHESAANPPAPEIATKPPAQAPGGCMAGFFRAMGTPCSPKSKAPNGSTPLMN